MHNLAIEFTAPFRIYLPERFFGVRLFGQGAQVKAVALPPVSVNSGVQVSGRNVEIPHDIFGFAGRTRFYVVLDQAIDTTHEDWKARVCADDHKILALAIKFVNRVLEVYRDSDRSSLGAESFHIVPLVRQDLSGVRIVVVDAELNEFPDFAITWPVFYSVGMGGAVDRPAQVVTEIENALLTGIPVPVERELVSSARNHMWRQLYRFVPVEVNTAFESFVPLVISKLDPLVNLPDTLDLYRKLLKLEGVISDRLTAKGEPALSWFSTPSDGWKTLIHPTLLRWHSDCYCLRNKIIHRGYNNVQREEADHALQAMLAACTYINAEVTRVLP